MNLTIKSLTGWIYSLAYLLYVAVIPYLHVSYPQYSILIVLMGFLMNGLDFMVSDSPYKNLTTLNKNGYSENLVIFYMTINLLIAHSSWIHIGHGMLKDVNIKYYFDLSMLSKIIITMVLGDIYFYFAHKALHESRYFAKLHLFHHCCFYPSLSTGLMFNPIDLMLEFTGPNVMLLAAFVEVLLLFGIQQHMMKILNYIIMII